MIAVVALKRRDRVAVLSDDTVVPVTNLFDHYGDEVDDWEDAASFVAGSADRWFACRCADFEPIASH